MKDQFDRDITYLRISITDACNLRCIYCMPEGEQCCTTKTDIMTKEEILEIAKAAVELGVTKIRITGGEPLVRPDIIEICKGISKLDGIKEIALTTNGILLKKYARQLKDAGVSRLNISLDTLDSKKYQMITRRGHLQTVLDGIQLAKDVGLLPIKINTVLIGGFNDDEIENFVRLTEEENMEIRFIELMPIGECAHFPKGSFIKGETVLKTVPELEEIDIHGVARMFRLPNGIGKVGIISPVNQHFCFSCNRIRLTCDGKIKPCLHSKEEILLRGLAPEEMRTKLIRAIYNKPHQHVQLTYGFKSETNRYMSQIGG